MNKIFFLIILYICYIYIIEYMNKIFFSNIYLHKLLHNEYSINHENPNMRTWTKKYVDTSKWERERERGERMHMYQCKWLIWKEKDKEKRLIFSTNILLLNILFL